jgi:hypothetical protein
LIFATPSFTRHFVHVYVGRASGHPAPFGEAMLAAPAVLVSE